MKSPPHVNNAFSFKLLLQKLKNTPIYTKAGLLLKWLPDDCGGW